MGAGLDAAVIAIEGGVAGDGGVLEIPGFLLGREQFDIVAQRALIALQGQDVVQGYQGDSVLKGFAELGLALGLSADSRCCAKHGEGVTDVAGGK